MYVCVCMFISNSDSKAVSGYGSKLLLYIYMYIWNFHVIDFSIVVYIQSTIDDQSLSHVCLGTTFQSIADHAFSNSADEFSSITSILIPS